MLDASSTNVGLAALTRWPTNPTCVAPTVCRQVTYGVLSLKVMSGRVAPEPVETGWPPLASWKRAAAPAPVRRDTKTCGTPETISSHTTHGTVAVPGVIVPAATRGSSASTAALALSEHAASLAWLVPQLPPCAVASRAP